MLVLLYLMAYLDKTNIGTTAVSFFQPCRAHQFG